MSGNVREWCSDCFADYTVESQTNPKGDMPIPVRSIRGGGYFDVAKDCRSSFRDLNFTDEKDDDLGMRLVLIP